MRYFVLLDKELRYYKHPDDTHAAGAIQLRDFQDIEEHNTSYLFGFKLVSETNKGHWIPILYAETKEEQQLWMKRIKTILNRLSNCSHCCSAHFCSLDSHHYNDRDSGTHGHHALLSVLDRWLNKLDLYDGSDDDSDYFTRRSNTSSSPNHSRSNSNGAGHSSSSTSKHRSNESIRTIEYNGSLYSEPATMTSSSHASTLSSGYHNNKRQKSAPITYHPTGHHDQRRQNSSAASLSSNNTHQSSALPSKATHISQITPSHQITKLLSIESERLKYVETTLQYFQHPHIHRSTSMKFRSELEISLSPPPPRR